MLAIRNEESACFWAMDLQLYITFVHTLFSGYAGRVNFNAEVWGNINGFVQDNRQVPKAHERELVRQQKYYKGLYGYFSDRCLGLQNNNKFTQYRKIPKISPSMYTPLQI